MRLSIRALMLAILGCLAVAAPASAGQIVFNANDEIRVANDDGSGERTLITPADVPGSVSVYYPWVQPNGGDLLFSARTPFAGANGLFCGFHCVGVYRLDSTGTITRISGAPTDCPPGDQCSGFDTDARRNGCAASPTVSTRPSTRAPAAASGTGQSPIWRSASTPRDTSPLWSGA